MTDHETAPATDRAGPPGSAALHLEHARRLRAHGALAAALGHFEGLAARPDADAPLFNAFGRFLQEIGDHRRAVAFLGRAVALDAGHPGYRFNLGLSLLSLGDLRSGWPFYEEGRRLERADPVRRYSAPEWQGESLDGKALHLWEEQGVGDTLLYGAMITDLLARGVRCSLECDPRLTGLFARAMPGLDVLAAGPFADVGAGRRMDFHAPLGSIGRFLRPALDQFPPPRPFLRADPARVAAMRARLAGLGAGLKVGLSWHSASRTYADKSIPLTEWGPVLTLPDTRFVALQYGDCRPDLDAVRAAFGVDVFDMPDLDRFHDLEGLAALIQTCDVIVTISNVTANIAGALGQPTLLLLGPATLWYWFQQRDDSPWYANMQLLRAEQPGEWRGVLDRAAEILARTASSIGMPTSV